MKTLSSALIIIISMLFVIPKITNADFAINMPNEIEMPNSEPLVIRQKKMKIELIKSEIGIILSEIKLKLPNERENK